jgi:putative transposase
VHRFLEWIKLSPRKFGRWQQRFGKVNEHNGLVPRDHQIEERQAIVGFFYEYPLEGYRRLAFMMLDRNLVAVSPSTVYRVLKAAGLLQDRFSRPSRKGKGFVQPLESHQHWHIDFSSSTSQGPFTICAACSMAARVNIVCWDIRTSMEETAAEIVLQRGREAYPEARPRIISDRGR